MTQNTNNTAPSASTPAASEPVATKPAVAPVESGTPKTNDKK